MRRIFCFCFVWILLFAVPSRAAAQTPNCLAAIPDDAYSDTEAINDCLSGGGTVVLESGVYYIGASTDPDDALILAQNGTNLVGQGKYSTWLYATLDLWAPMLRANADNFSITDLSFFGINYARDEADQCNGDDREGGSNILIDGDGWTLDDMQSSFALCGTGLGAKGVDFTITNSRFIANGLDELHANALGNAPWADAITIWWCDGAEISNNYILDATDIGIVLGGGTDCDVSGNTIENLYAHGFAGIHVGNFDSGGDHDGIDYVGNSVYANEDQLAFGIVAGFHPWNSSLWVSDAGTIYDNVSEGAVVNFAVDGVGGGSIYGNTSTSPQGTWGFGCSASNHYTAGHYSGVSLQSGVTWVSKTYDNGSC